MTVRLTRETWFKLCQLALNRALAGRSWEGARILRDVTGCRPPHAYAALYRLRTAHANQSQTPTRGVYALHCIRVDPRNTIFRAWTECGRCVLKGHIAPNGDAVTCEECLEAVRKLEDLKI